MGKTTGSSSARKGLREFADSRPHGSAALRDAFVQGYATRLAWPEQHEGQIDTLIAGRQLRRANWVLAHETARFAADPSSVPDPAKIVWFFERLEAEFRGLVEEVG